MKLSELITGTPLRIQAFKDGQKKSDIWGKIKKNSRNECQIDIYYYEGSNIDLNSPEYEICAIAFCDGEQEIEWDNQKFKDLEHSPDRLVEQREAFRIYIGEPVECMIQNMETVALLVDMSEGGFRIMLRDCRYAKEKMPITLHVDDDEFDFRLKGHIVWEKKLDDVKSFYGCSINLGQDMEVMMQYIKKKQKKLFDELQKEISEIE